MLHSSQQRKDIDAIHVYVLGPKSWNAVGVHPVGSGVVGAGLAIGTKKGAPAQNCAPQKYVEHRIGQICM